MCIRMLLFSIFGSLLLIGGGWSSSTNRRGDEEPLPPEGVVEERARDRVI